MGQAVLEWRRLIPDLLAVSTFDHAWGKARRVPLHWCTGR